MKVCMCACVYSRNGSNATWKLEEKMSESILADILNGYLKPYVKKLDTSQLQLGIWKGRLVNQTLFLRRALIDWITRAFIISNR